MLNLTTSNASFFLLTSRSNFFLFSMHTNQPPLEVGLNAIESEPSRAGIYHWETRSLLQSSIFFLFESRLTTAVIVQHHESSVPRAFRARSRSPFACSRGCVALQLLWRLRRSGKKGDRLQLLSSPWLPLCLQCQHGQRHLLCQFGRYEM